MAFLTAAWRQLAFINYEVDPALLEEYVPFGTELDFYKGTCYVSVIAFYFMDTKVLGIKFPYHVNFEEVNLRFYVKRREGSQEKRAAVFIKEVVPKQLISFVANTLYNENYETLPMQHTWEEDGAHTIVDYRWKKHNYWQYITLKADKQLQPIPSKSEMEFITEHYWGYAAVNKRKTNEYEVIHPRWKQYPLISSDFNIDFEGMYGAKFAHLQAQKPASIFLIDGSEIAIENKTVINS